MSQIETFRYRGPDQKKLEVHGLAAVGEVFVRRLASGNDHVEGPQSLWRYVVLIDFSVARGVDVPFGCEINRFCYRHWNNDCTSVQEHQNPVCLVGF